MIQPQINNEIQSPDNECMECAIYTGTLWNTDFKAKNSLERYIKNMHDAYSQKEKGENKKWEIQLTGAATNPWIRFESN